MRSQSKLPKPTSRSVHTELKRLGLRAYNKDARTTRAVFKHNAVLRLYKLELPSLFGILLRDEGTILSREDPQLFDKELEELLREFGPLVWPEQGEGDREHLLDAQAGTLYESDLIYPRDRATLKHHLRRLILAKNARPDVDIQALIEKRHKDAKLKVFRTTTSSAPTNPAGMTLASDKIESRQTQKAPIHRYHSGDAFQRVIDSDSNDSVIRTTTRRQANLESATPHTGYSSVELRLYRSTDPTRPGSHGPVHPYSPWFLLSDCTTLHDCFARICEWIGTDCSFMIFRLPEDMSQESSIRLDRGSSNSEVAFQRVLDIFGKAKKFPGEPQYHSVEVQVGLDMVLGD